MFELQWPTTTPNSLSESVFENKPQEDLLAKLEEANKRLEADAKAASLRGHSRKGSDASQVSSTSASSAHDDTRGSGSGPTSGTAGAAMTEESLWSLWGQIVSNWESEWKRRNKFIRELVRQGVPHHFRGIAWQLLAGADNSPQKKLYSSYIKANSVCEKLIRHDIVRTYPKHDFFKEKDGLGQESLFNVMKAYSLHDPEVGYCQGSCFIVGLLLMQMPEEEAFAVLVNIMQHHRMREIFKPSMAELGLCMFQLENLLQEFLPELHNHFQTQGFNTSIYSSSWFLTLFTTNLSLNLACRIMDVFLIDGIEIVFKVSLALLMLGRNDLLSLDMEGMLKYVQQDLPAKAEADHDAFLNMAYSIQVNMKKMKKLEKEYAVLKVKEQSDVAAMRCLRQENRLLKQRVELLEKESSALAERLVRGQVDRAEGQEERFLLLNELNAMRRAHVDAQQRLALAYDEIRSMEMTLAEMNSSNTGSLEEGERGSGEGKPPVDSKKAARDEELIRCLQRELVRARLQTAEREAAERELRARLADLDSEIDSLRKQQVDNNVAHLQDELIAVKLREAEAILALKELRQRVTEISDDWIRHMQEHRQEASAACAAPAAAAPAQSTVVSDIMSTPKKLLRAWEGRSCDQHKLDEELMSTKIRELEALSELKELRLRVNELETQIKISTNQLKRQDNEIKLLRDDLDAALQRERTLLTKQREYQHKYSDLESKAKSEAMQANIRNMEDAQRIAELEHEVFEYKLKNEVIFTEGELRSNTDDCDRVKELQDEIADLQAEVLRLEDWKARKLGLDQENSKYYRLTYSMGNALDEEDPVVEDEGEKLKLILRQDSTPDAPSVDKKP